MNRKLASAFILSLVLFSCTIEDDFVYQELYTTVPELNKRTLTEALEIAQEATSLFGTQESRSGDIRTIDTENIKYLCLNNNSRSQSDDTLLYVINYADDNGFAVVSANPNTTGLIAVTEKGTYNPASEEINNNGGMAMFMNMAKMYVSDPNNELQKSGSATVLEFVENVDTTDTYIFPKLATKWGQSWPEGRFCSNLLSGCVNTALAQIMAYFEHPIQMNVTYDNAEISVLNLDWSEIKKYVGSSYSNTANSTTLENIGHLC